MGMLKKHALAKAQGFPGRSWSFVGFALFAPFALTYSVYVPGAKAPTALPEERHVLACTGWAGETAAFLNIPSWGC